MAYIAKSGKKLVSGITTIQPLSQPKCILWFEQTITDDIKTKIEAALTKLALNCAIVDGCKAPYVVELN